MKKTLVLASLLAAFGAASAQSSVTLYGQFDQGLGRDIAVSGAKMQLNPGTSDIGGFRFGLRGTEVIGGGLTAKFGIETSDTAGDTGNPKTPAFSLGNRGAWVGVAGAFGDVRLGRHATLTVLNAGTQTNFGWRGTASMAKLGLRGGIDYQTASAGAASRTDAAITYLSNSYSGLTFGVQHSLKDDNYYVNGTKKGYTAFAAGYSAGPLTVQGYSSDAAGVKSTFVGGAYNLGVATVGASYTANKDFAGVANKGFTVRAKGAFGAFAPGIELTKQTTGLKLTGMEIGTDYSLSPRTALTVALNKTKSYQAGYYAGVRHAF